MLGAYIDCAVVTEPVAVRYGIKFRPTAVSVGTAITSITEEE